MLTSTTKIELKLNMGDYNQLQISHEFGWTVNVTPGREGELDMCVIGFNDKKQEVTAADVTSTKSGKLNVTKLQKLVRDQALAEVMKMKKFCDELEDAQVVSEKRR